MMPENSIVAAAAVCLLAAAPTMAGAEPVRLRLDGEWSLAVEVPGERPLRAVVAVPKPDMVAVANESYPRLPEFDGKIAAGWRRGVRLTGVIAAECTMQGALEPESLVVRDSPDPTSAPFRKGTDYEADLAAGTLGRLPGGRIGPDQPVFISYRYAKQRIDSIVLAAAGGIVLRPGTPHTVMPEPPGLGPGDTRLANVFLSGRLERLSEDNLFPILETAYPEAPRNGPSMAESRLPKTLGKLRSGEPLRILAWGDSVTTFERYQVMFVDRLRERFPRSRIELITEAWGGRNTGSYLKEPPGSVHNYQEKVLDRKADLIVSEFVNDASLDERQVEERYGRLLEDFRRIGAEWIILTPHYIRPDWMKLSRQREIDEDPRPYVKGLRLFAAKHRIALADASLRYGRLWRQGIPYLTLMDNNINHPNLAGHRIFADSLIALFP